MLVAALSLMSATLLGCGRPGKIIGEEVVSVTLGPDAATYGVSPTFSASDVSLNRLISAYNAAKPTDWQGDTTPALYAVMAFSDGNSTTIWFSGVYPEGCAQVVTSKDKGGEEDAYRIRAPDLLPAILELGGKSIDRQSLESDNGTPWLPD